MLSTQILNFGVTVLTLVPTVHHGATGIALSFAAGQVAASLYSLFVGRRFLGERFLERIRAPVIAASVALVIALPALILLAGAARGWASLGIYAAAYVGVLLLVDTWVRSSLRPAVAAFTRVVAR